MNWPTHFPNNCPPQEAEDAAGFVYRLISDSYPDAEDFKSWREQNMDKELPTGVTECQASGLSIYRDKVDADKLIRKVPRFKKSRTALGLLTPDLGKILNTPSRSSLSHHTWWIPAEVQPWTIFKVVNSN